MTNVIDFAAWKAARDQQKRPAATAAPGVSAGALDSWTVQWNRLQALNEGPTLADLRMGKILENLYRTTEESPDAWLAECHSRQILPDTCDRALLRMAEARGHKSSKIAQWFQDAVIGGRARRAAAARH